MFTTIRTSAARLFERSRIFLDALSGADDPQGEYLFRLEQRVHRLEADMAAVRSFPGQRHDGIVQGASVDKQQ